MPEKNNLSNKINYDMLISGYGVASI